MLGFIDRLCWGKVLLCVEISAISRSLKKPQTLSAYLAEAEFGGRQGADLQIGQERFDALSNRRHPS